MTGDGVATPHKTVVIADYDFGDVDVERAIIEKAGFELTAAQCKTEDEVIEVAHDAAAVVAQYATISARVIGELHACRVIARYGTGVDIVDVDAPPGTTSSLPMSQATGARTKSPIMRWLCCSRSPARSPSTTGRRAEAPGAGNPANRSTACAGGCSGCCRSAQSPGRSRLAPPVRHAVTAHDPYGEEEEIAASGATALSFDELVTGSDCLVIQAPLTPETHHLFDEAQLRRMKPTSILVNTARGPIIDDRALHRALSEGWIAGAGLDDIEEEPAKVREW